MLCPLLPLVPRLRRTLVGAAVGAAGAVGASLPSSSRRSVCAAAGGLLQGRVCVVTGGSAGIGLAIVTALHAQGALVVAVARNPEKLQAAAEAVGDRVIGLSCDVTDEAAVVRLFATVAERYEGRLDLLVNCAGVLGGGDPAEISAEEFSRVLTVNVVGPFVCSREALKLMKLGTGGRILNVGSIAGTAPRPNSAPYSVSKAAVSMLTKSLALDARAHGVSVGAIHPGNVLTEMVTEEEVARRTGVDGSGGPNEGFLTPEDVASVVVSAALLPPNANLLEQTIIPLQQPLVGRG